MHPLTHIVLWILKLLIKLLISSILAPPTTFTSIMALPTLDFMLTKKLQVWTGKFALNPVERKVTFSIAAGTVLGLSIAVVVWLWQSYWPGVLFNLALLATFWLWFYWLTRCPDFLRRLFAENPQLRVITEETHQICFLIVVRARVACRIWARQAQARVRKAQDQVTVGRAEAAGAWNDLW